MSDNIIHIRDGQIVTTPYEASPPDPLLIEQLEALLADARSGTLIGMCVGSIYANKTCRTQWAGDLSDHDLMALSARLAWRINKCVDEVIQAAPEPPPRGAA